MDIAIDVRSLMEGRHSGVEEYTTQLIKAFTRVAPQHIYRLFYNSMSKVKLPNFEGNVVVHGFHYPNKFFNLTQWGAGLPRWDYLVPADCFFVPNVRLMPLSIEKPIVVTAHDLSFERFPEFYSHRRRLWHRLMRPKHLMKNADHVIAVSEATAQDLVELYHISSEKLSVIHSGVSITENPTKYDISKIKSKYSLPEKFILYFGTFEPRKNIPSIVKAFSAIADNIEQDLVLAGSSGWLEHEINQAVGASIHRERIHVIGFVDEDDKSSLYAAADLFVYPSFYEGFGFPPLEALLNGTPVITSLNSSLPEVVGEWAALVDPYNPSELALLMKELLHHPVVISDIEREKIKARYSWDKTARQTLSVIEGVS